MPVRDNLVAGELRIGGRRRSFTLRLPHGTTAGSAVPLVLALHGRGGTGQQMRRATSFDAMADAWGFAVAYPDGYRRNWADGRGYGEAVHDVAFLRTLIDWSAERHGTAREKTIVAGMSAGAFMGHRLAVEAGEQVAVLGAVAGGLPDKVLGRQPSHAVSVLLINGSADRVAPIDGRTSSGRRINGEQRRLRLLSLQDTAEYWRTVDRCEPGPGSTSTTEASSDRPGWFSVSRHTAVGGVAGTQVAAWTVHGGGHTWPGGARPSFHLLPIGPTAPNFDAAEEICRFALPLLAPAAARQLQPNQGHSPPHHSR